MRLIPWPRSLFGRLIAASILALLLAQAASLTLVARERERFILQGSVREWSRRIVEVTTMLEALSAAERATVVSRLEQTSLRVGRHPSGDPSPASALPDRRGAPNGAYAAPPPSAPPFLFARGIGNVTAFPFPLGGEFDRTFEQQLKEALGPAFQVAVQPASDPARHAISITGPVFSENRDGMAQPYDATVTLPDGYQVLFRVTRVVRNAPLPRGLFLNLSLLLIVMVIALFVTARSITRPLSNLARAADRVGRDLRQPRLEEKGARELRDAAHAFNTMQDRLQRYLDSRSRVLAAMSHDLKTPLTRLRLQVELVEDPSLQMRLGKQLDEMESMVHGSLALFRGLDDDEAIGPIELNELLATLQSAYAEMGTPLTVEGRVLRPVSGKPQALRRCLTNLIDNAIKFGSRAALLVEDGESVVIRIRDEGPGIPAEELEKVFEPFYRLESSRNRDTGGTGLGLSIARDVVQAHGGSLVLRNLPGRGLEALLTLPRGR
ncbi:MAG TPA: HAMP domain-containing sensor histidine kinase [Steroidobacteraceae bacterium]